MVNSFQSKGRIKNLPLTEMCSAYHFHQGGWRCDPLGIRANPRYWREERTIIRAEFHRKRPTGVVEWIHGPPSHRSGTLPGAVAQKPIIRSGCQEHRSGIAPNVHRDQRRRSRDDVTSHVRIPYFRWGRRISIHSYLEVIRWKDRNCRSAWGEKWDSNVNLTNSGLQLNIK